MKIVCECGTESVFNTKDKVTGEERESDEDGQYATVNKSKFGFWQEHDKVGFFCKSCNKAIWLFT